MKRKITLSIAIILIIIVVGLIGVSYYYRAFFSPLSDIDESIKPFIVNEGEGASKIALNLKDQELIKRAFDFEAWVWLRRAEKDFKVGEFGLSPSMSVRQIVNLLTSGIGSNEITIKILEGWTVKDIGFYLENEGLFQAEEVMAVAGWPPSVGYEQKPGQGSTYMFYDFLKDKSEKNGLEGYLFPDTYRIFNNATVEDIVRKMLDNFEHKITSQMITDINKNNMGLADTIILASILEKELKTFEDKRKAASVFYKRLNVSMALQADSTVNYVTGSNSASLSKDELQINSEYNTYKHRGLPPSPICNPGLDSIKAAIYPDKNDYWYFLTDQAGNAYFAKDLAEHGENRIKYLNK